MHQLTIIGILIWIVGTGLGLYLIHIGKSKASSDSFKKVSQDSKKLAYPIPAELYADITIDLPINGNPKLIEFREKLSDIGSPFNKMLHTMNLSQLEDALILSGSDINISDHVLYIFDQFSQPIIHLSLKTEETVLLNSEGSPRNLKKGSLKEDSEIQKEISTEAFLRYLPDIDSFSIYYKNIPLRINYREASTTSIYDLSGAKIFLDFLPSRTNKNRLRGGYSSSSIKKAIIKNFRLNRLILNTESYSIGEGEKIAKEGDIHFSCDFNIFLE